MAAKKTAELVPLCHTLPLSRVDVDIDVHGGEGETDGELDGEAKNYAKEKERKKKDVTTSDAHVNITATAECTAQTGVEMEALCAATMAALTVYDMCKALDKGMVIGECRVVEKRGGRSGDWRIKS